MSWNAGLRGLDARPDIDVDATVTLVASSLLVRLVAEQSGPASAVRTRRTPEGTGEPAG